MGGLRAQAKFNGGIEWLDSRRRFLFERRLRPAELSILRSGFVARSGPGGRLALQVVLRQQAPVRAGPATARLRQLGIRRGHNLLKNVKGQAHGLHLV